MTKAFFDIWHYKNRYPSRFIFRNRCSFNDILSYLYKRPNCAQRHISLFSIFGGLEDVKIFDGGNSHPSVDCPVIEGNGGRYL